MVKTQAFPKIIFATIVQLFTFAFWISTLVMQDKTGGIMRMRSSYQSKWDIIGIGASLACAIHCVLLPIIFTTLPFFGIEILENPYLEAITLLVSMLAGGWAIWRGYSRLHHKLSLLVCFLAGLFLLIAGNFCSSLLLETGFKITGAALIITAHIRNWRSCNNCSISHTHAQ